MLVTFQPLSRLAPPEFLVFTQMNSELICELNATGSITLRREEYQPNLKKLRLGLYSALVKWSKENGNGFVPEKNTYFVFKTGAVRQPAIAWLKTFKKDAAIENSVQNILETSPDYVAEFLTAHDNIDDMKRKMREYITNGTALAWLLDADGEKIHIFRAGGSETQSALNEKSTGEEVMRGFVF